MACQRPQISPAVECPGQLMRDADADLPDFGFRCRQVARNRQLKMRVRNECVWLDRLIARPKMSCLRDETREQFLLRNRWNVAGINHSATTRRMRLRIVSGIVPMKRSRPRESL